MSDRDAADQSIHRRGDRVATLVAALLLAVVLGLLTFPLVSSRRIDSRRAHCRSQLRNVSTALHTYATMNNGRVPMLRGIELENDADPDNAPYITGWAFALLPCIEQHGLYDSLLALDAASNSSGSPNRFDELASANIQVYACPDSPQAEQPGALTYVANMGYMTADVWDHRDEATRHRVSGTYDWNNGDFDRDSPEDARVSRATGVFVDDPGGQANSFDGITDGTSNTIMLAENINAGPWISGHPHDIGFAVRFGGTTDRIPLASESSQGLGGGTPETALQFHAPHGAPTVDLGPSAINAPAAADRRGVPRPSSAHAHGVVNLFFADGSGRTMSPDIDPTVYARLVSSAGERYGQGRLPNGGF